jgi:hypothetical protein
LRAATAARVSGSGIGIMTAILSWSISVRTQRTSELLFFEDGVIVVSEIRIEDSIIVASELRIDIIVYT